MNPEKINLLDFDEAGLKALFVGWGEKSFRAVQLIRWMHQRGEDNFQAMTDLSNAFRLRLSNECEIKPPPISEESVSVDGTRKWLLGVGGGSYIETVFIPEPGRGTLCISSQVGCALNCTFCSTATQGFNRNLSTAEIIGQLWLARRRLKEVSTEEDPLVITNIVMMGMGEPLLNLEAVTKALSLMRADEGYALPRRRVTVSTSGVAPAIYELAKNSDVSLALSLHAPTNELRSTLVPINKKYPIEILLEACREYIGEHKSRHVTMEYVMLRGINDSPVHARQLVRVLGNISCKVNLIPFNPFPGAVYERSTPESIQAFHHILAKAKLFTTTRKTRGDDIDAACGQLVGKVLDRTKRHERFLERTSQSLKVGNQGN